MGPVMFAAVAARVYARIAAAAPSHSVVAAVSDDANMVGTGDGLALATCLVPLCLGSAVFARDLLDKTVENFHQFGSRLIGLAGHFYSHTATLLSQVCGRRFGHHLRFKPRGLCRSEGHGDTITSFPEDAYAAAFSTLADIWDVCPDLLDTPSMRTQLSLLVQFGGLGDNVVVAYVSNVGAAALVVGQVVTFLRAQHAIMSDYAGAFLSEPSGVFSPHSLYLVHASSIHKALVTPALAPDADANVSAPMWAVELHGAHHTRVGDECGDGVLEDLAGPLASALKLLLFKRSPVIARAGCSAVGAEQASAMRSAADL
eukprot:jgi/Tetstr1/428875/TSEL_018855.t1